MSGSFARLRLVVKLVRGPILEPLGSLTLYVQLHVPETVKPSSGRYS